MEAGCLMEPPVSVPVLATHNEAARLAADPPEEPPGTLVLSQGLLTGPKKLDSLDEPMANSSIFVLPRVMLPALFNLSMQVDV